MTITCEHFRRVPIDDGYERCITCGNDGPAFTGEVAVAAQRRNASVDDLYGQAERYYRRSQRWARFPRIAAWLYDNYEECYAQAREAELEPLDAWEGRSGWQVFRDELREILAKSPQP